MCLALSIGQVEEKPGVAADATEKAIEKGGLCALGVEVLDINFAKVSKDLRSVDQYV